MNSKELITKSTIKSFNKGYDKGFKDAITGVDYWLRNYNRIDDSIRSDIINAIHRF